MEREKGCFQASFNAEIGKFASSTPTIASLSLAAAAVKRIILEGGTWVRLFAGICYKSCLINVANCT